ncbi:ABC transporter ATP-binding protein (plasmid) [Aminobacter sp. UC22_36]|uniref:ABC transporter ATP-binding protein n=1 Tax=Aminobacter sp. UC22_36 TaxID=3374549 RepID=UPI0037565249
MNASPDQNGALLQARNVTRRFGELVAVNDVSFDVLKGEIFGIAGPNGSGKSTLFNILTGIPFGPSGGRIIFKGEEIQRLPAYRISQAGLVRTFQKDAEFPTMTARENVVCGAVYCGGLRREAAQAAADDALDAVGFDKRRQSLPAMDLSVYERKQLMIASAISGNPAMLLLDQPAAGLTKPEIKELGDLVLGIRNRGVTIILIEHVLTLLLKVSERLMVLNQGAVLAHGDPHEVVRDPRVVEAYLGKRELVL